MAGSPDFMAGLGNRLKNAVVQRVIGVVALLITGGIVYGVRTAMQSASNAAENAVVSNVSAAPHHAAHTASASTTSPAPAPVAVVHAPAAKMGPNPLPSNNTVSMPAAASVVPANGKAAKAAVNAASNPNTRLAASDGAGAPVVTAVTSEAPKMSPQMAHLDEHTTYQYNALGRRDPFQSLVSGDFVGDDVGGDAPPDVGGLKVVGIVWGAEDQFAMAEDVRGNSFVLRKGDKVQNGVVTGLKRDAVMVEITADGQSQTVTIPLTRKGDKNAR